MRNWVAMMEKPKILIPTARENEILGCLSSSSDIFSGASSSESESESEFFEEVTSLSSSSSSSSSSSLDVPSSHDPLTDMSSLIHQLPVKRGLSNHYDGKSRSFTSLSNVRSLEDLSKQENPSSKRLKTSRSYGGRLGSSSSSTPRSSKCLLKTLSRSCSSVLGAKGKRPPIPPHRSNNTTNVAPNQTALFA